ncbi:MAG: hypothetical protein ABF420_06610 [Acetobacter syzygii]
MVVHPLKGLSPISIHTISISSSGEHKVRCSNAPFSATKNGAPNKNLVKNAQILVTGTNLSPAQTHPVGQTTCSADKRDFGNQIGQSVADMMVTIPSVSFTQGNGPHDTNIPYADLEIASHGSLNIHSGRRLPHDRTSLKSERGQQSLKIGCNLMGAGIDWHHAHKAVLTVHQIEQ